MIEYQSAIFAITSACSNHACAMRGVLNASRLNLRQLKAFQQHALIDGVTIHKDRQPLS